MSPWPRRLALHGLFLATALLIFWGRWQGRSPFIYLGVDAGRIATNAAMCDYPENFRWLAVRKWGVLCVHPHVFLVNGVRLLENMVGDFGTATVVLLVPVVFLQLWGFFLVGRVLFGEDRWALALTFLQLPLVWIRYPVGTHWGIYEDPWARHLYQAVLPFLLWAALKFVDRPAMWPWVLLANGVALYFHWRNGFGWMLALGGGFLAVLPKVVPERRRWWWVLAGMGLAAILFLLPPLWYYRGVFLQLLQPKPVSPALMALVARLQWEYVQYVVAAPLLLTVYSVLLPRLPVLVLALLGLWAVRRLPDARLRLQWRMVQVWGVVLLLHAVALHLVPPRFSITVFRMYFLRNARFLIPLALLFAVAFLVYWAQGRLPRSSGASWATWGGAWVPVTALAVFPITLQVQGWRPVERFLNLRAVDLTLRVMARVSDPDSVLWTRPYFRLALQTALDDLLFVAVLLVVLGVLALAWRAPLEAFGFRCRLAAVERQAAAGLGRGVLSRDEHPLGLGPCRRRRGGPAQDRIADAAAVARAQCLSETVRPGHPPTRAAQDRGVHHRPVPLGNRVHQSAECVWWGGPAADCAVEYAERPGPRTAGQSVAGAGPETSGPVHGHRGHPG